MSADGLMTAGITTGQLDPDALVADLFSSEGRSLVRLARMFCDDQAAAEDLVQEAFIRLHRSASSIRDVNRAPAFLRSAATRSASSSSR